MARRTPGRAASTTRSASSAAPGDGRLVGGGRAGADEEVLAVEALRDREEPPGQADHDVPVGVGLVRLQEEHLDPGEDQEGAEDVDDPGEALDQLGADRDHGAAHQQGAHDAPEEDAVLVDRRHREEAEEHRDHEDVVDGQRLLDEVAGEVLDGGAGAVVVDGAHPLDRLGRERHHVGGEPEPEPVVLVAGVDEAGEGEAEGDPEGGPAERLPDRDDVGLAVEDAEVEGEEGEHEGDEAGVHPDHPHSIGPAMDLAKAMSDTIAGVSDRSLAQARARRDRRPSARDDRGRRTTMALGVAVLTLAAATAGGGPRPALMPWPSSIEMGSGELAVGPGFRVAVAGKGGPLVERAARRFEARLARQTGLVLPDAGGRRRTKADPRDPVRRAGEAAPAPRDGRELHAHGDGPRARCCRRPSPGASCAGMETFLQLVAPGSTTAFRVPAVVVKDRPRFPWRGLMLDSGAPLHAARHRQADARRHGGGEAERAPLAPHRGPGLPRGEPALPGAPPHGLGRPLLHAGPGPGDRRVRRGARHPGVPRVRHARAHHELVRAPPRARLDARSLRDRAAVGDHATPRSTPRRRRSTASSTASSARWRRSSPTPSSTSGATR